MKIAQHEERIELGPFRAIIQGDDRTKAIVDGKWISICLRGFATEAEALHVGQRLKAAVVLASARVKLGVDIGVDNRTNNWADSIVATIRDEFKVETRSTVHGVDVYSDEYPVIRPKFNAEITVLQEPEPFLSDIGRFPVEDWPMPSSLYNSVLLLNAALINSEPLAKLVLAISAVESLGQDEDWTSVQMILLDQLSKATSAVTTTSSGLPVTTDEATEVAEAIERMHRIGLAQGVKRVLERIGLGDLKGEWNKIYKKRSSLVHGLKFVSQAEAAETAERAINLSGRIIFTAMTKSQSIDQVTWAAENYLR